MSRAGRGRGWSRLIGMASAAYLVLTLLPAGARATEPPYGWQSGPLVESQDANCITGEIEQEAGAYMSYYFKPSAPPLAGETYYVAINVTGIGNTCAGIYADVELAVSPGTEPAVDSTHPVQCFLQFPGQSSYVQDTQDCPHTLASSIYGYSLNPTASPGFWPLPQGGSVEVNVPVRGAAGVNQLKGVVQLADGESDPVLQPYVETIVDSEKQKTEKKEISVSYEDPSISGQHQSGAEGPVEVTYTGYVWNHEAVGSAYAEIAFPSPPGSAPSADCDSPYLTASKGYPLTTSPAALKNPDTAITGDFTGLYPGTPYCWRIYAEVGGTVYSGNWQFFETTGAPIKIGPYTTTPSTGVANCSASGSGCLTSNCETGGSCSACPSGCLASFAPVLVKTEPVAPPTMSAPIAAPFPAPTPAPTVTSATEASTSWREGSMRATFARRKPPVGTTFSFMLNEQASVTLAFTQQVAGRSVRGMCVAPTSKNRLKHACKRIVTNGTLSFAGHAGKNTVSFAGLISASKRLPLGRYTLVITASAAGQRSQPRSLSFTIAK